MKKQIVCLLLLSLLATAMFSAAVAAPLFPDVPEAHWAKDAVADLAAKGILEGYPDGTFKGDRAATRWEMALMIQRALARMEQEHSNFASKAELEALKALVNELKDELDALGVRVTNLEESYNALDQRTTELERVRFYGYVQGTHVFNGVGGSLVDAGSRLAPVVDWTNGRFVMRGTGSTMLAKFGTIVRATKDTSFGMELAGFSSTGDDIINNYWGVTPPSLSNPFTSQGSAATVQSKSNIPWTKVTMDRFWFRYAPTDTILTVGSFLNEKIDHLVLYGERNPNINAPEVLPFYGINLKGRMNKDEKSPYSYEVSYSRLPQASFMQTQTFNGSLMYKAEKWQARLHALRAYNRSTFDGVTYLAGTANAPVLPSYPVAPGNAAIYWRTAAGAINNNRLGPQNMYTFGFDLDGNINKNWTAFGKVGVSVYNPDTSKLLYNTSATGAAYVIGVKAKYDKVDGKLQYQYVTANYDPMVLQYGGPGSGIPVFLPYSTYYVNYYQLHDYINYPSNRNGLKFNIGFNFSDKTRAEANAEWMQQSKPSTVANMTTVGFVEPLFPYLQTAGSTVKGSVFDWGLGLRHYFTDKFVGKIGYFNYSQRRNTFAIDDVDLKENLIYGNLRYDISPKYTLTGGYTYINYNGHTGLANTGFKQHVPAIGAEAKIADSAKVGITYRHYIYKNKVLVNSDWHANSLIVDWKMDF